MSSKKYLTLEEAAAILKIKTDELIRLREKGDVRGFADRGTWKFKAEDVEELHRRRQPDSNPEVPMLADDDDLLSRQPTIITKGRGAASDSDVRLVPDDRMSAKLTGSSAEMPVLADSDSDVRLSDTPARAVPSDSDVQLVAPKSMTDSDSDVRLTDSDSDVRLTADSDSDVRLAPPLASDSDVKLVERGGKKKSSDSDVTLLPKAGSKSGKGKGLIDFDASGGDSDSVLLEDSGMAHASDSGITLEEDSGIRLGGDSGIKLEEDSGIRLGGDSGIKLAGADSGIKLSGSTPADELDSSVPLLLEKGDAGRTDVEVPMLADSSEMATINLPPARGKKKGDTSVVMFEEDEESELGGIGVDDGDESYSLSDSGTDDDELEVAEDILGEDDELEQLEVFDSDDSVFDESFVEGGSAVGLPAMGSRLSIPQEPELGGVTFSLLAASTLALGIGAVISVDLLRSVWGSAGSSVYDSSLVNIFAGLFK